MFKHKKLANIRSKKVKTITIRIKNGKQMKEPSNHNLNHVGKELQNKSESLNFQSSNKHKSRDLHQLLSKSVLEKSGLQKSMIDSQNKENYCQQSNNEKLDQTKLQGSQQSMLQQVILILSDIKNQNTYLMERNAELEYILENDIKAKLDDGFRELKSEIKSLKKENQQHNHQMKRLKMITSSRRNKFASTKQLLSQNTIQEEEIDRIQDDKLFANEHEQSQLEGGAESTFMRNLDSTQNQIDQSQHDTQMRLSLGANLLQIMQFNNKSKNSKKPARNFNFRCNLQEIDKIIEEDTSEIPNVNAIAEQCNTEEQDIIDINKSIEEENVKRRSISRQRPQTGQRQTRKAWAINPRKSIKKRQNSKDGRPKTAAQVGLRIKGFPASKNDNEDPILALLREENEITAVINEPLHQEVAVEPPQIEGSIMEQPIKQSNAVQAVENENLESIQELEQQKQVDQVLIIKPKAVVRRGMFKAPPANLIEQLLQNDIVEQKVPSIPEIQQASPSNFRQGRFIKVNNFLDQDSRSRSASKQEQKKDSRFPQLDFCDDEEEKLDNENPFDSSVALTKGHEGIDNSEESMINLFFHRKNENGQGDTAEFGQ